MDPHRHTPRNPLILTAGISGLVILAALVNLVPPDSAWIIALFMLLTTCSAAFLLQYVFQNFRQTLLLSGALCIFLLLRTLGLRNPVYTVLLIASVLSVEITLKKR